MTLFSAKLVDSREQLLNGSEKLIIYVLRFRHGRIGIEDNVIPWPCINQVVTFPDINRKKAPRSERPLP